MLKSEARITDRFRKRNNFYMLCKRKLKLLTEIAKDATTEHPHTQEKARRRKQIERGILKIS